MVHLFGCPADQLWGIIARGVCNRTELQNIDDCMEAIREELGKPSIKDWLGTNVRVNVQPLPATRNWRDHIPALGVKLEGGLLRDDSGNHMFLSMLRRGWGCDQTIAVYVGNNMSRHARITMNYFHNMM